MKRILIAALFVISAFAVNAQTGTTQKSKKMSKSQSGTAMKDSAQMDGQDTTGSSMMHQKHKMSGKKSGKGKMKMKTSTDTNSPDSTK